MAHHLQVRLGNSCTSHSRRARIILASAATVGALAIAAESWVTAGEPATVGGKGGDSPAAARALVEAAFEQRRPQSIRTVMAMRLIEGKREWPRDCVLFARRRTPTENDQLFRFTSPADLAGSAVLTRENRSGEDDQWVYLPAYHMARRIAAGNRGDAYLGTDYFYEDVLEPRWDEYRFALVGREKVDNLDCTKVEVVPVAPRLKDGSAYGKTVYWIEPRQRIIVKQESWDKTGRLLKRLRNSGLKQYGRYLLWDRSEMENVQSGHRTVTETKSRQVDMGLPDEVFSQKALKRGG